ncbi:hypothetical protein AMHIJAGA_02045 [Lactococcus lactis]|uniref:BppU N-terminal domain-containing protein n=1 Tax=Lactococcus lactis TaxID=1358 RepID=A0A2X0SSU7_9LACT|nr:BppU family phage baseplate upper protein [Lactococcus lactis]SPS12095.1 hypothetical protein AMHIJAGA_02045 [Lactococcus lactis]
MTEHFITLSTTEPNNYVGLLKMRQGDTNTQEIEATITANGQLFKFDRLSVFFNAVLPNGNVIRDKVTEVNYVNSKLNYVVADSFLQDVAQVTAWFSFENGEKIIDSTKNFQYSVIGGWKECIPQGNYIYELSEIQREIEEIIGNKDFTSLLSKLMYFNSKVDFLGQQKADKTDVAKVEDMVSKMPSATPKETFNNLSKLKEKYPSGSTSAMVVLESDGVTGYVYLWNGSEWKKGALYQGLGLVEKSVTFDKLYVDSFDALSTANVFGGKGIVGNDGDKNIILTDEPNSTVYRIPLDQTGFMNIKLIEPVVGYHQSIFVVDKNNKMVFRSTWNQLQQISRGGWKIANNSLEVDIELVRQVDLADAIYINIPTSRINEFKAETIENIDLADLKYLDLRNYKNPPSESLGSLSDKYMPFESEKLLNKRLIGYVPETGEVSFENDSSWMTFKIINVPNKGTLTLPKSSITSDQLFVLEDSDQVCFNHIYHSNKEPWFNVSETSMTISFTDLIRMYPRTVTLYVGFKKADDENFFSEAKNIAQLSDVFKWAEDPNQDKLTEYNLNFPPYVPLVAGKESYIYFDNLLIDKNFYVQSIPAIARNRREDKVVLSGISNYTQSINIGGVSGNIPIKSISESAGAGKNLKVMVIGESTSEDGRFMTNLKNFFDSDVVNIDFIGTRTSGGVRHEARSGWGSGTLRYIGKANNATNSFWNPEIREFDLDYYFSQHSDVPIPDVILLNFGINEVNRYVTDGRSGTQSEHYDFFIREFRKKNPNLISIIGLSHSFSRWSNYWMESERDNIMKRTKQTIEDFKDRESERIFLNPWYVCLDMRWDFQYSEIKSNQFSEKTSIVGTDGVHPAESGYKNMALMSYFAIKNAVSKQ